LGYVPQSLESPLGLVSKDIERICLIKPIFRSPIKDRLVAASRVGGFAVEVGMRDSGE